MKRFIVAIVALVYLGTSNGVMLHMHYCMGNLAGWGLVDKASKICSGCGMEKSLAKDKGCCEDKYKFIKSINDQKVTGLAFEFTQQMPAMLPVSFIKLSAIDLASFPKDQLSHAPPLNHGIPVYLLNCNYRI